MKLKITLLSIFFLLNVIAIFIWGTYFKSKCTSEKSTYIKDLTSTFHQAVLAETSKRLLDTNTLFIRKDEINRPRKERAYITLERPTIYINRTEEYERLTLEEKDNLFLQTLMVWDHKYLRLEVLNDIWNAKLQEKRITNLETGVKYRHRDLADTIYSDKDSLFFVNSSRIDWYVTGIFKEIDLQGHYNFSFHSLYLYAKKDFIIYAILGIILILSLVICCYWLHRVSQMKINHLIIPIEEKEYLQVLKSDCYSLNDHITLYVDRALLVSDDGREAGLTPKMVEIFEQFITSPVFYVNNKVLWKNVWGVEEDPSNVLTQMIKNIRNEIAVFPEMGIRNIHKRGYQLFFYLPGTGKIEPPYPTSEEMGEKDIEYKEDREEKIA